METPNEETPLEEPNFDETIEEADSYHSRKNIFRLASWANILAWLILVIYLILFIARMYFDVQHGVQFQVITVLGWLSYFSTLLIGVIWFVVLQGLSEGMYLLLDVFDKR